MLRVSQGLCFQFSQIKGGLQTLQLAQKRRGAPKFASAAFSDNATLEAWSRIPQVKPAEEETLPTKGPVRTPADLPEACTLAFRIVLCCHLGDIMQLNFYYKSEENPINIAAPRKNSWLITDVLPGVHTRFATCLS